MHINTPPPPPSTQSLNDAGSLAQELWHEKTSSPLEGNEWKLAAVSVIRSHLWEEKKHCLSSNGVFFANYFNSFTLVNFLGLNKHQAHTADGSNHQSSLFCGHPHLQLSLLYLHFQNGCTCKNFILVFLLLLLQRGIMPLIQLFCSSKSTANNTEI